MKQFILWVIMKCVTESKSVLPKQDIFSGLLEALSNIDRNITKGK